MCMRRSEGCGAYSEADVTRKLMFVLAHHHCHSKPIDIRIMNRMVDLGFQDEVVGLGIFHDGLSGSARELVMQPRELNESGEYRECYGRASII